MLPGLSGHLVSGFFLERELSAERVRDKIAITNPKWR